MRILSLLSFALMLCASCLASDPPVSKSAPPYPAASSDLVGFSAPAFTVDPDLDRGFILSPADAEANGDVYCLKLRTYKVKRESPNSDVVRPSGYTTCLNADRVRMKSTVEPK